MAWNISTLETEFKIHIFIVSLSFLGVLACTWYFPEKKTALLVISSALLCVNIYLLLRLAKKVYLTFSRATLQVDSLKVQDSNLIARAIFPQGRVGKFHSSLRALTDVVRKDKAITQDYLYTLYGLIDQLATPILVFNQHKRLSYANETFSLLFGHPWQTMRHASADMLGLEYDDEWIFSDSSKAKEWSIKQSTFLDEGRIFSLLVFIDIHTVIRKSEIKAWKNITSVLTHEIRNSLTPVSSLVQSLLEEELNEEHKTLLSVILERCLHLQEFVKRYSEIHHPVDVRPLKTQSREIFQSLNVLFKNQKIKGKGLNMELVVDPLLLHQVLINLVTNAVEAGSPEGSIQIHFYETENNFEIRVIDKGRGIGDHSSLFVPFYTTKVNGKGIGLSLSRHIIEQMGGRINLFNNKGCPGTYAQISLPKAP